MLSAEIDNKKKELLRTKKIAEDISEQLFNDEQKMRRTMNKQGMLDKELGVSTVLINDISRLKSKRRVYFYISGMIVFIIVTLIFAFRFYRFG